MLRHSFFGIHFPPNGFTMSNKKPQQDKRKWNPPPTVQHESSAGNAQYLGFDKTLDTESETRKASTHRRGHSGSDGTDEEDRGSNH